MLEGTPANTSGSSGPPPPPKPQPPVEPEDSRARRIALQIILGFAVFGLVALVVTDADNVILKVLLSGIIGGVGAGLTEWLI